MSQQLNQLVQAAHAAAQQGHWQDAEKLWNQVRAIDPRHPQALHSLGMQAFRRGALAEALHLLQLAHQSAPREPMILVAVAMVLREQGDVAGERRAIDAALQADAYCLPALLAKAAHVEHTVGRRAAAPLFRNALKVAPPEPNWPPGLRSALQHARQCVDQSSQELSDFLQARLGTPMSRLDPAEMERWREAGALVSGRSQPYPSVPNRLLVPRIPAIPFFAPELFPWVEALQARTAEITEEMHAVHATAQEDFRPYIDYAPGVPVNQWQDLNHSKRWSSYFLWQHGAAVPEHQQACPRTTEALAEVGMADIGGLCPNAMFSALSPHTAIPPHHGETNARLVVHLPLVVPEKCLYRVGFERRQWQVGKVLVFDDSIEHEARNDSDELRVVLIFDVWNPLLSSAERDMVRALNAATLEFHAMES